MRRMASPYQQVQDWLRDGIRAGRWRAGDQLPTEAQLCAQFGLSRMTVNRALRELNARVWLTGLRRDHASSREELPVLKQQNRVLKVHPIIDWTDRQIGEYLRAHDLPYHPLWEQGYISVGDVHSTTRYADGMRPEDTRFSGLKRECGLHEQSGEPDYMI